MRLKDLKKTFSKYIKQINKKKNAIQNGNHIYYIHRDG